MWPNGLRFSGFPEDAATAGPGTTEPLLQWKVREKALGWWVGEPRRIRCFYPLLLPSCPLPPKTFLDSEVKGQGPPQSPAEKLGGAHLGQRRASCLANKQKGLTRHPDLPF